MIWVTSQPDEIRFIWETMVQEKNFAEHGIDLSTVYCLFGTKGEPSIHLERLKQTSKMNILYYPDNRSEIIYAPSIQPHLLKQFYKEYKPDYVFHIDSDVIIRKMPPLTGLMDGNWYVSDADNYLGYQYIRQFPEFLEGVESLFGLSVDWLITNEQPCGGTGGPNYLMCGIDETFWEEVEEMSTVLYHKYKDNRPINHKKDPIQIWTAGMWAWIWCAWKRGIKTYLEPELNFCMSDHPNKDYNVNFFHNTGGNTTEYQLFNKCHFDNKYPFDGNKYAGDVFAQNHYLSYINQIIWEQDDDIGFVKRLTNENVPNWWIIEGDREPTREERQYLRNIKNYKYPVSWNEFTIRRKFFGHDKSHI